ncbi:hypothetical protein CRM22_002287 [Opisthorchis felineus]|nr:hypothetical protein CRM22_002287 [Opisthorchis felineus]
MKNVRSLPDSEIEKFFLPAMGFTINGQTISKITDAVIQSIEANAVTTKMHPELKDWIASVLDFLNDLEFGDDRHRIETIRNFFDLQMETLYYLVEPYADWLDEHDKRLLRSFRKIRLEETKFLVFCPYDYLQTYLRAESYHFKRNYGQFVCALRLLLVDLMYGELINADTGRQAYKVIYLAYAEASANIFLNKVVSGEYLALPIIVIEKLNRAIPREYKTFESVTLQTHAESVLLTEMVHQGLSIDQVIRFLVDRTVLFYYNLGNTLFCELKDQWAKVRSFDSLVNMAFANVGTPCIQEGGGGKKRRRPKREKAGK